MKLLEKKQKQIQRILRNLFLVITIISYTYFSYQESMGDYQNKPIGYLIGAFLGISLIPVFCWIVYYLVVFSHRNTLNSIKQEKINKINSSSEFADDFNFKLNSLNQLLEINAISLQEFNIKKQLLIRKTAKLVGYTDDLKHNKVQMEKLKIAWENAVISKDDYGAKVNQLIAIEIEIKNRITEIEENLL